MFRHMGWVPRNREHQFRISQGQPAIKTDTVPRRDGGADEVPLGEIVDAAGGFRTEDGIGLEEEDAVGGFELFPEPGLGQKDGDGAVVGKGGGLGEEMDADPPFGHEASEGWGGGFDPGGF